MKFMALVTSEKGTASGIIKGIDYKTLLFFVGLFIVVGGLEQTGILKLIAQFIDDMSDRENRVRLLMDRDLKGQAYFACHPCVNTSSLKFKTEDLFEKVIPAMGHVPTFIAL